MVLSAPPLPANHGCQGDHHAAQSGSIHAPPALLHNDDPRRTAGPQDTRVRVNLCVIARPPARCDSTLIAVFRRCPWLGNGFTDSLRAAVLASSIRGPDPSAWPAAWDSRVRFANTASTCTNWRRLQRRGSIFLL